MRKSLFLVFVLLFSASYAQDIHFSQHWAAPVSMNPALTGKFNGMVRATFNYRNQWFTIPTLNASTPYRTFQASVDGQVLPTKRSNNRLGVGLSFFNDKAGDGALQTNYGMVSIAYHQSLNKYGNSHLSFGLQAGVLSKRINFETLIFENQLNGNFGWNPAQPNGEPVSGRSVLQPDVNIGVMFTSRPRRRIGLAIGYAMHHVASPRESFLGDEQNGLDRRHVATGSMQFNAGYNDEWTVSPVFLFMMQANATLYHLGLGVNYQTMNENVAVFGGAFYRVMDAAILNLGVELWGARVGVSYDINHSDLRGASRAQGALELSLVYVFGKQNEPYLDKINFCPTFM